MSYINHPDSTPSSFRSKLGSYATGLAIGCILMGFFLYQKHLSEKQAEQNAQQTLQQSEQAPGGINP